MTKTSTMTHEAISTALCDNAPLSDDQRAALLTLIARDKQEQADHDTLVDGLKAEAKELKAFLRSRDANIVEQNRQLNQFRVLCADQAAELERLRAQVASLSREAWTWSKALEAQLARSKPDQETVQSLTVGGAPVPATWQAETFDNLLKQFESYVDYKGQLWERCQGKGWPEAEDLAFTNIRDRHMPELRARLLGLLDQVAQPAAQAKPVAWRDHVEQRIREWRHRTMNRSGDRLAIDDFMDAEAIDDMVDYVCDAWAAPPSNAPAQGVELPKPFGYVSDGFPDGLHFQHEPWPEMHSLLHSTAPVYSHGQMRAALAQAQKGQQS